MVATRSQTTTLNRDFSNLFIRLKGGPKSPRKASPKRGSRRQSMSSKTSRSPIRKANSKSPSRERHSISIHDGNCPSKDRHCIPQVLIEQLGPAPKSSTMREGRRKPSDPKEPIIQDVCDGSTFFPSRAWGEKETIGLSKIGRADKEVEIWEEVYRAHQINEPRLLPVVERSLQQARKDRAALDETLKENVRVGAPDPVKSAIQGRLDTLEWALNTSRFEPEMQNIRGAIAGYLTGTIQYSDHYTLMYAGQVVDTASTYGEFVRDRQERLDRYALAYGPHWLWWEPPLKVHHEDHPRAMGVVALKRDENYTDLGHYRIMQGYWKRSGWVMRMPQLQSSTEWQATKDYQGRVDTQAEGPKLAFRSLLDSGATFPTLHTEDLSKLGINGTQYACQSVTALETAAGVVNTRTFELYVCVLDNNGLQLVDPKDSVFPTAPKYLGSLCPVVESAVPLQVDANGMEKDCRLSGLLPFVACYVACAPTRNILWLGEDRNDVLGQHRMPGQKKWDISFGHKFSNGLNIPEDRYDNPLTTFEHRNGKIIDYDDKVLQHVSHVTFMQNTEHEVTWTSDPMSDWIQNSNNRWKK